MANHQLESVVETGWVDKRRAVAASAAVTADSVTTPGNFTDVAAMRTRLAAISGTTFSAARLDAMTVNDMVYALRLNDESAGL